eukprot:760466-Hanusia_phi.AAC.1
MVEDVLKVFEDKNVTYKYDPNSKSDYSAVPSLDGDQCIKFQEEVLPGIIDVLYPNQPDKREYCKAVFENWCSIDRTISKKHRHELTAEEIESLPRRLNSFAI